MFSAQQHGLTNMKPTQTLIAEHEVIVQMLDVAERMAQAPGALDTAQVAGLIEFFADKVNDVELADVRHHQLEFVRRVAGKTQTK